MALAETLIDHLDARALKCALGIQIPLTEHLGPLRSVLCGVHAYLYTLTDNTAHVDYLLSRLETLPGYWHEGFTELAQRCAQQRLLAEHRFDLPSVLQAQAIARLTLAADLLDPNSDRAESIKRYQIYACHPLLGQDQQPPFFSLSEIERFIAPDSTEPAVLFIRQFTNRLGKPELIRRELNRHVAPFDAAEVSLELNLLEPE